MADPPYTPTIRRSRRGVSLVDFLYDSETDLERHHFDYRADADIGPQPDADRRLRLRRRARRADQLPVDGRAAAARTQQHRHDRAVQAHAGARRSSPASDSRTTAASAFTWHRALAVSLAGLFRQRRRGRHTPSRQRRTRHQGAALHPVVQPESEFSRQSRSQARAVARIRRRRRAALRARSRRAWKRSTSPTTSTI